MVARLFKDHDDVIDWATSPAGPDINRLLVKVNGLLETPLIYQLRLIGYLKNK